MKITKKTKKKFLIGGLILLGIIIISYFGLRPLDIVGTIGTKSITKISEDSNSVTYQIISQVPSDRGVFLSEGMATSGNVRNLGLGETTDTNSEYRDDLQLDKTYQMTNVQFYGLSAIADYGSDNAREVSDVRVENVKGYCNPSYTNVCKMRTCLSFNCEIISADLKAYENNEEVGVSFYGITKVTTDIIVLKKGIQCTDNQLVNCQKNQECVNNVCELVVPPSCPIAKPNLPCEGALWIDYPTCNYNTSMCVIPPENKVYYRLRDNSCTKIEIPENQKTLNDYSTLDECKSKIVIGSGENIYYRFENNNCKIISMKESEKNENDYSTLNECQSKIIIEKPPYTILILATLGIIAFIGLLIWLWFLLRKK